MDPRQLAQDFLMYNALNRAPYDPKKNTPQDLGLGGESTEYSATVDTPQGTYKNIPQIWYDKQGKAQLYPEEVARSLAQLTERVTGRSFPEYTDLNQAVSDAEARSRGGGAERQSLLDYADMIKRYK